MDYLNPFEVGVGGELPLASGAGIALEADSSTTSKVYGIPESVQSDTRLMRMARLCQATINASEMDQGRIKV